MTKILIGGKRVTLADSNLLGAGGEARVFRHGDLAVKIYHPVDAALTADEREGYVLFKSSGCIACHNGPAAGGASFRKMGVVEPYRTTSPAEGRVAVTGRDADRFSFKVPTLRNVELTYPYFHDGAAETLADAVEVMGRIQLGRRYTAGENAQIVAFLKTLTGDQPRFELPILPPSSETTPRPRPFS